MAKLCVEYTAKIKQYIDWPDDELESLDYETLMINLDPGIANDIEAENITSVKKNGEQYYF